MATITMTQFVTLDGVVQGPGGADEDRSSGFDRGGWLVPYVDEAFGRHVGAWMAKAEGFLLGRKSYDILNSYWPKVTDPQDPNFPAAELLNNLPKYVASRTVDKLDWNNTTVIKDVAAEIPALKAAPGGEIQIHGSGNLAQSLTDLDLIDVYRLLIFPVAVGGGKKLFADDLTPSAFRLIESATTSTGVLVLTYESAGRPAYGDLPGAD